MKFKQYISVAVAASLCAGVVSCGESSSSVSSRVKRITKYLDDGEYSQASSYVSEHKLSDKEIEELTPEVKSRVDAAVEAYSAGTGDYDTAYSLISCAQRMNLPDLIVPLAEASTKIEKLHTSDVSFESGKSFYESGNYLSALQYLERVPEDTPHYAEAQTMKEDCLSKYRSDLESQVKSYTDNGDYEGAMHYLEGNRYSVSDSEAATEILNTLIADIGVAGVLGDAQKLLDQGDLAGALKCVETFEDDHNITDSRLDDFSNNAKSEYLNIVLTKAGELVNQRNYASALKMVESAQELISDSRLDALKEKILAEKPTYLSDLFLTNKQDYTLVDSGDALVDTVGNTYPVGNLYTIKSREGYGEYNLGYRFNHLTGTVAARNDSRDNKATLKIIGDDVTLYSVEVKRAMTPVAFDVDVSSVNWLKITMTGDWDVYAILADCQFDDGSAPAATTSTDSTADTTAEQTTTTTASADE